MSDKVKLFDENTINKKELEILIDEYLNDFLEPNFEELSNNSNLLDGKNYYAYKTIKNVINKRKVSLQEDLKQLDFLEYLFNKNLFPVYYQGYICRLIETNNNLIYRIMNNECQYTRGTEEAPYWNEINVNLDTYCYKPVLGSIVCKKCNHYLDLIKKTRDKY